jgi:hypothetical protein
MKYYTYSILLLIVAAICLVVHHRRSPEVFTSGEATPEVKTSPNDSVQPENRTGIKSAPGLDLIEKTKQKKTSSANISEPNDVVFHSKSKLSDPDYVELLNRHFELKAYMNSTARGTENFKKIEQLLSNKGYGKEYVRRAYEYSYLFHKNDNRTLSYEHAFSGAPRTKGKTEVLGIINRRRSDTRKQAWKLQFEIATGIGEQELIDAIFDVQVDVPFGPPKEKTARDGEELILKIDD